MSRMPEIGVKADLPEDKGHILDTIADQGGAVTPFALLLNSPEVAGRVWSLRQYLFSESTLTPLVKNLAAMVAARECDCAFVWGHASFRCRQAGAREEVIDIVGFRRPLDSLTEEEALIVTYGRELLREHRISDATFAAAKARFGNQGLTDLTAILGFYTMIGHLVNAFDVEPWPDRPRLP